MLKKQTLQTMAPPLQSCLQTKSASLQITKNMQAKHL